MFAWTYDLPLGAYAFGGTVREASEQRTQKIAVIVIGYVLGIFLVLGYARAGKKRMHPKFRLNRRRARRLLVHVAFGTMELTLGARALLVGGGARGTMRASAACVLVIALTAMLQIDASFGTPSIITPALHIINTAHIEKAFRVLIGAGALSSDSSGAVLENFIDQLVLAQGFVYSRMFIFAFTNVPGIKEHRYTTGATLALFLVIPAVYGPVGALIAIVIIAAYSNACGSEESGKERNFAAICGRVNSLVRLRIGKTPLRTAFDVLDKDGNGTLDGSELREQLFTWGVDARDIKELFERIDISNRGSLSFEEILNDTAGQAMLEYISVLLHDNESLDGAPHSSSRASKLA